jgi:hypothetical protein
VLLDERRGKCLRRAVKEMCDSAGGLFVRTAANRLRLPRQREQLMSTAHTLISRTFFAL